MTQGTPEPTAAPSEPTSAASLPAEPTAAPFRIGYLADGNGSLGEVIQQAAQAHSWAYEAVQATPEAARVFTQSGAAVLVIDSTALAETTPALAQETPQTYFISLHQTGPAETPPNLLRLGGPEDREDQAGFLAGLVAGFATQTERVAVFSDTTTPGGLKYRSGFVSGVRYACPKCRLDVIDVTDPGAREFFYAEGAKYAALGADVVFAASAQEAGLAVLAAASKNGAWVIGGDGYAYEDLVAQGVSANPDRYLTSVDLDPGSALTDALNAYDRGQPRSGAEPLSLANGGVAIAPLRNAEAVLSPLDLQDIEAARARLADRSLETGVDPLTGQER